MCFTESFLGSLEGGKKKRRGRHFTEEGIRLKTPVCEKEERFRIALKELGDIIGGGSNDEDGAAQSPDTLVSPRGRTKSASDEVSLTAVSSALRAGDTYL